MGDIVVATKKQSGFLKKKYNGDILLAKLKKLNPEILGFLLATLRDEQASKSLRVDVAFKILDMQAKLLDNKNKDEIIRLEKQVLILGKPLDDTFTTNEDDEEEDETPLIDFDNISDVN